jgi:hypothetical protein
LFAGHCINHHRKTFVRRTARVSIAIERTRRATQTNNDIGFDDKSCTSRRENRC